MKNILFILLMLAFCSCEKWQVEAPNLSIRELVVVNSLISPQDSILVAYVSRGEELSKIVKIDSLVISDAKVIISDGFKQQELFFNRKNRRYESLPISVKITENKQYSMIISYKSKTYEATCTVPKKVENLDVKGQLTGSDYTLTASWIDTDDDKNTYLISSLALTKNQFSASQQSIIWDNQALTTDRIITSRSKQTLRYTGTFRTFKYNLIKTTVAAIDYNLEQYIIKQGEITTDGGVFEGFTERKINYSNIKGGAGVFGAYNESRNEINIK